jgi:hypothetical protein
MATFTYNRGMHGAASGKRPGRLRSSTALSSFDVKEQPRTHSHARVASEHLAHLARILAKEMERR